MDLQHTLNKLHRLHRVMRRDEGLNSPITGADPIALSLTSFSELTLFQTIAGLLPAANAGNTVLIIGSGVGSLVWGAAICLGAKSIGIENDTTRCYLASKASLRVLNDAEFSNERRAYSLLTDAVHCAKWDGIQSFMINVLSTEEKMSKIFLNIARSVEEAVIVLNNGNAYINRTQNSCLNDLFHINHIEILPLQSRYSGQRVSVFVLQVQRKVHVISDEADDANAPLVVTPSLLEWVEQIDDLADYYNDLSTRLEHMMFADRRSRLHRHRSSDVQDCKGEEEV